MTYISTSHMQLVRLLRVVQLAPPIHRRLFVGVGKACRTKWLKEVLARSEAGANALRHTVNSSRYEIEEL